MILIWLKRLFYLAITPMGGVLLSVNVLYGASDAPMISLDNTNFVVSLAFVAFLALIFYLKVPSKVARLLDDRSTSIEDEIKNANLILEESKMMLADIEREHKTNIEKAKKIIVDAENEAKSILADAKKEIRLSIERKVKAAEDQIKVAEEQVIKSIKDQAIDQSILMAEAELISAAKNKTSNTAVEKSFKEIELGLKHI